MDLFLNGWLFAVKNSVVEIRLNDKNPNDKTIYVKNSKGRVILNTSTLGGNITVEARCYSSVFYGGQKYLRLEVSK